MTNNATTMLKGVVGQIVDLEQEIDGHREDQKEFYNALNDAGFHVPTVRKMVARMKKDRDDVVEADEQLFIMEQSMGMKLPDW